MGTAGHHATRNQTKIHRQAPDKTHLHNEVQPVAPDWQEGKHLLLAGLGLVNAKGQGDGGGINLIAQPADHTRHISASLNDSGEEGYLATTPLSHSSTH